MSLLNWAEIPEEPLSDTLTRRAFSSTKVAVATMALRKGCLLPAHSRESEQMSTALSSSIRFALDGREWLVRFGETQHIPNSTSRSAEYPVRNDLVQGRDTHLQALWISHA